MNSATIKRLEPADDYDHIQKRQRTSQSGSFIEIKKKKRKTANKRDKNIIDPSKGTQYKFTFRYPVPLSFPHSDSISSTSNDHSDAIAQGRLIGSGGLSLEQLYASYHDDHAEGNGLIVSTSPAIDYLSGLDKTENAEYPPNTNGNIGAKEMDVGATADMEENMNLSQVDHGHPDEYASFMGSFSNDPLTFDTSQVDPGTREAREVDSASGSFDSQRSDQLAGVDPVYALVSPFSYPINTPLPPDLARKAGHMSSESLDFNSYKPGHGGGDDDSDSGSSYSNNEFDNQSQATACDQDFSMSLPLNTPSATLDTPSPPNISFTVNPDPPFFPHSAPIDDHMLSAPWSSTTSYAKVSNENPNSSPAAGLERLFPTSVDSTRVEYDLEPSRVHRDHDDQSWDGSSSQSGDRNESDDGSALNGFATSTSNAPLQNNSASPSPLPDSVMPQPSTSSDPAQMEAEDEGGEEDNDEDNDEDEDDEDEDEEDDDEDEEDDDDDDSNDDPASPSPMPECSASHKHRRPSVYIQEVPDEESYALPTNHLGLDVEYVLRAVTPMPVPDTVMPQSSACSNPLQSSEMEVDIDDKDSSDGSQSADNDGVNVQNVFNESGDDEEEDSDFPDADEVATLSNNETFSATDDPRYDTIKNHFGARNNFSHQGSGTSHSPWDWDGDTVRDFHSKVYMEVDDDIVGGGSPSMNMPKSNLGQSDVREESPLTDIPSTGERSFHDLKEELKSLIDHAIKSPSMKSHFSSQMNNSQLDYASLEALLARCYRYVGAYSHEKVPGEGETDHDEDSSSEDSGSNPRCYRRPRHCPDAKNRLHELIRFEIGIALKIIDPDKDECSSDPPVKKNLGSVMPKQIEDWKRKLAPGPKMDNFVLQLDGGKKTPWNKAAAKVFCQDFLSREAYKDYKKTDIEQAFFAHITQLKKDFKKQGAPNTPAYQDEQRRSAQRARRLARRTALLHRRMKAFKAIYSTHPGPLGELAKFIDLLICECMSGDESGPDKKFFKTTVLWRSQELMDFLNLLSAWILGRRYLGRGAWTVGKFPNQRYATQNPECVLLPDAAPRGLPRNWYDQSWLEAEPDRLAYASPADFDVSLALPDGPKQLVHSEFSDC
ncbi:hypothetical protein GYMLUDRAFT_61815 [Collybiopsis luxurians FD-317 M1]|uniref:Uncharacterized protein n=1 Tax=Collybiopsis luxurians FD-317 M1 TaxID=944289 RepID=A0A0D0CNC9_9AGAR|nr:hypothetical protein GYMLUDRAFT_61815 [Collybiopsis luxurians FD-317 M1]